MWQVWLGFTFHDLPKGSPERAELFTLHKTVGVTILILALVRLAVRLINPPPPYPTSLPGGSAPSPSGPTAPFIS